MSLPIPGTFKIRTENVTPAEGGPAAEAAVSQWTCRHLPPAASRVLVRYAETLRLAAAAHQNWLGRQGRPRRRQGSDRREQQMAGILATSFAGGRR